MSVVKTFGIILSGNFMILKSEIDTKVLVESSTLSGEIAKYTPKDTTVTLEVCLKVL